MKNLVIVESPSKAKTIEKILGKDYKVLTSFGHIRDLSKKGFEGDIASDFSPAYEIPDDKKKLVSELKSEAKKADMVWLASDEDREGEAIAWHLYVVLGLKPEKTRRIVFHEITKPAILKAIENPRDIDLSIVDAQQARRVLDRIVGFELSPVLWRKIKPALSAGRVQSVTARLVCEREKEIRAFKPEPYFKINAMFSAGNGASQFRSEVKNRFETEEEARQVLEHCNGARFRVTDVTVKPVKRSPLPPFTTSTLQQEAGRKLGFSVNTTMMIAQRLYEEGKITYMRTDSLNLSPLAVNAIAGVVTDTFGKEYSCPRRYHTKSKGAQEAHEAIRPTYPDRRTVDGTAQEQKLYELIWNRTVASQMADAQLEKTNVEIETSPGDSSVEKILNLHPSTETRFEASGETVVFDGFLRVMKSGLPGDDQRLPLLEKGDELTAGKISATERFTQSSPRYTEDSLVKKMEELGIGRPSTYASTISTIQTRDYVRRGDSEGTPRDYIQLVLDNGKIERSVKTENTGSDKGKLVPTDTGMVVNDFLTEYFPEILDYNFTAKVEEKFDDIEEGKLGWKKEINDFYKDFHPVITEVSEMRTEHKAGERILGTDPATGKTVSVKIGRFGPVAQIGEASDEEKPRFAQLVKNQSVATITLEEALKLFRLPRLVGEYEGKPVKASAGRFGPYISYDGKFVSIPKDMAPLTITLDEAVTLIRQKEEAEAKKLIKEFDNLPDVKVLNGRFGPYIAYKPEKAKKAVNYKIPKGEDPAALTAERVKELMEAQDAAPKKKTRKSK